MQLLQLCVADDERHRDAAALEQYSSRGGATAPSAPDLLILKLQVRPSQPAGQEDRQAGVAIWGSGREKAGRGPCCCCLLRSEP